MNSSRSIVTSPKANVVLDRHYRPTLIQALKRHRYIRQAASTRHILIFCAFEKTAHD
jgi:hypothetical protein